MTAQRNMFLYVLFDTNTEVTMNIREVHVLLILSALIDPKYTVLGHLQLCKLGVWNSTKYKAVATSCISGDSFPGDA